MTDMIPPDVKSAQQIDVAMLLGSTAKMTGPFDKRKNKSKAVRVRLL